MRHIDYKVERLLHEGFSMKTITSFNKNQINLLYEKVKKEPKEAVTTTTDTKKVTRYTDADADKGTPVSNGVVKQVTGGFEVIEGEVTEKFKSKAQQGLFWAKCNNSKGKEKKKWCDMAKEFSDSTTKKDYKKMPEKTVKTKSKKSESKESVKKLEEGILRLIESHLPPHTTKGELLNAIKRRK